MTLTPEALHLEAQVITPRLATIAHHCQVHGIATHYFYVQLAMELGPETALDLLNEGSEEQIEEVVSIVALTRY